MNTLSKRLLVLICCAISPLMDANAQTQCSDGKDNDRDGRIDAYVELPTLNGQVYEVGGTGDPTVVRGAVENAIRTKKFSLTPPTEGIGSALLRSDGGSWDDKGQNQGIAITEHLPTLQTVCRVLGYRDYVSSTCRDDERSFRYPYGKCNYHTAYDNNLWRFKEGDFRSETADPKHSKTWIASIKCTNKLAACDDGWDNDGDGLTDMADSGCLNANDDSEFIHDPKCTTPSGSTEAEQCRNGTDDDADGLIDAADPGCWTNTTAPTSYDPNLDNEARATSQCQDGTDNDGDGATDLGDFSCGGSKQRNDESNPKSQCQDGIDNDEDGAIDRADFSCSSNQDNDEGDPQSQCQDGVDNDEDGLNDMLDPGCSDGQDNDESGEPTILTVGVRCVMDNQDGTYTAYFDYDNLKDRDLEIPTAGTGSTRNELSPGGPIRGQVTTFRPGLNKGAFSVVFDGQPLTWSVRAQGASLSQATASLNSPECGHVEPIAECIDSSPEGLKVTFSYRNPNDFPLTVPVGSLNFFAPAPLDRGQPTVLKAGLNKGAFSTLFQDNLAWNLDGMSAVVTKSTPVCAGGCVDTPIGTVKSDLNETALNLAVLARKAAKQLGALASKRVKQGTLSASMASKLTRDAARAARKAGVLSKRAQSLALGFPEVIKSCPFSPPFCETVDRGETIEALRGLYADIVDQVKRIQARKNFKISGTTMRNDELVVEGKRLNELGNEQLDKLPRVATVCE
jgi:hypothetical protein